MPTTGLKDLNAAQSRLSTLEASEADLVLGAEGALFEHFVTANGGKVPYPIARLKSRLDAFAEDSVGGYLFMGSSRSLQKAKVSFKEPRLILSLLPQNIDQAGELKGRTAGRLFLGYARAADQIEVISWNNSRGAFDFGIIANYTNKNARYKRVPDEECVRCHQFGTPIFPRFPWRETAEAVEIKPTRPSTAERIAAANPSGFIDDLEIHRFKKQGPGTRAPAGDVFGIDIAVRSANKLRRKRLVCEQICTDGLAPADQNTCRGLVLKSALVNRFGDSRLDAADRERLQSLLERTWPADGYAYPSSVLPDRAATEAIYPAGKQSGTQLTRTFKDDEALDYPSYHEEARTTGNELTFSDPLALETVFYAIEEPIPQARLGILDPERTRPKTNAVPVARAAEFVAEAAFDCLGLLPVDEFVLKETLDLASLAKDDQVRRLEILADQKASQLGGAWPKGRRDLILTLLDDFPVRSVLKMYAEARAQQTPQDATSGDDRPPTLAAGATDRIQTLQRYCAPCHVEKADIYTPIPFNNQILLRDALMAAKRDETQVIFDHVDTGTMPPKRAQTPQPSAAERQAMLRELEALAPAAFGGANR